ncbi:MAG: histidinol-phosphate transaminase [Candidatus Omnitrophica bacterium]|nr:histidinol-phosphate transaminase [Candidatus Omnitrophota bacterium]
MGIVREDIRKITPYKAGKPIEETRRELSLRGIIKLASNENPLGVSPKALKAILKNSKGLNRYPDSNGYYLKQKLSCAFGVSPSNLVLGNGSDELIDVVIKTFVEYDENIITSATTFLEYAIIAGVNARKVVLVALKDFKYDLEGIRRVINSKTKLIFIANPNNPTGTYVNKKELDAFLNAIPKDVVVVLDEAYDTFIDVGDFPESVSYYKTRNVVLLKTFSKAYGLAGLRIGFAIANSEFCACMEKVRQPFNVNSLAQAAALASLGDRGFLRKTKKAIWAGKQYLYDSLDAMGLAYVPSVANFILVNVEKSGIEVFKKMLTRGVIVRDMQQYGLKDYIRITVGTMDENRKCINALKKAV